MKTRSLLRGGLFALALPVGAYAFVHSAAAQPPAGNEFVVRNLVSNGTIAADRVDTNLVNAWGLARSAIGPWWVADNGTDLSTVYDGSGAPTPRMVRVPGAPTGAVFNGGSSFVVSDNVVSAP